MAALIIAESHLTAEQYEGMVGMLDAKMRAAPGFIAHVGGPIEGGWRVVEVWETSEAANQFFAKEIHPNLPPGAKPKRTVQQVSRVIRAG